MAGLTEFVGSVFAAKPDFCRFVVALFLGLLVVGTCHAIHFEGVVTDRMRCFSSLALRFTLWTPPARQAVRHDIVRFALHIRFAASSLRITSPCNGLVFSAAL